MLEPNSRNSWKKNPDTEHQKCETITTQNYKDIKIHVDKIDGKKICRCLDSKGCS